MLRLKEVQVHIDTSKRHSFPPKVSWPWRRMACQVLHDLDVDWYHGTLSSAYKFRTNERFYHALSSLQMLQGPVPPLSKTLIPSIGHLFDHHYREVQMCYDRCWPTWLDNHGPNDQASHTSGTYLWYYHCCLYRQTCLYLVG